MSKREGPGERDGLIGDASDSDTQHSHSGACSSAKYWALWCWYSVADPQYRDFLVATRRLADLDAKLSGLTKLNSVAIDRAHGELRRLEEALTQGMNAFVTRLQFREQQYRSRMAQMDRPIDAAVGVSREEIESWLGAEEIELKFQCMLLQHQVEVARAEIKSLYTMHSSILEYRNSVVGYRAKIRNGEYMRSMLSSLSKMDESVLTNITMKCAKQTQELADTLDRMDAQTVFVLEDGESAAKRVEPPQNSAQTEAFWEAVLSGASVAAAPKRKVKTVELS